MKKLLFIIVLFGVVSMLVPDGYKESVEDAQVVCEDTLVAEEVCEDFSTCDADAAHDLEVNAAAEAIISVFGSVTVFDSCMSTLEGGDILNFEGYSIDVTSMDYIDLYDARGGEIHLSEVIEAISSVARDV